MDITAHVLFVARNGVAGTCGCCSCMFCLAGNLYPLQVNVLGAMAQDVHMRGLN
jgi:hypothetical protein